MADGSQTLERGLAVLSALAEGPLTTTEVAAACGLHRSIAHRLLVSLHRTGYAERDPGGRYAVGPAVRHLLSHQWGAGPDLRTVAAPVLHDLAAAVGATASLLEVHGDAAVAVLVAEPPLDGPRFSYRVGNRDPLDRGAGGLAALASGPPLPGEPARVSAVRADGLVATYAEINPGAHGVAVPLPGWPLRAALTVVTADAALARDADAPLRAAAAAISTALLG